MADEENAAPAVETASGAVETPATALATESAAETATMEKAADSQDSRPQGQVGETKGQSAEGILRETVAEKVDEQTDDSTDVKSTEKTATSETSETLGTSEPSPDTTTTTAAATVKAVDPTTKTVDTEAEETAPTGSDESKNDVAPSTSTETPVPAAAAVVGPSTAAETKADTDTAEADANAKAIKANEKPAAGKAAEDTQENKQDSSRTAENKNEDVVATNGNGENTTTKPTATTTTTKKSAAAADPLQELWTKAQAHAHGEVWGVTLADPAAHVPSQIVFQKYLNANDGDLAKAIDQLVKTLDWRQKMQPLDMIKRSFSKPKFDGLGYVTTYSRPDGWKDVFTWNVYGLVKDMGETFKSVEDFIAWRTALMELALQDLGISTATTPITATSDPYKITQVHDYRNVSFLRPHPAVKASSTETIKVFAQNYPELLREKFFVNVPALMGWMYTLMKMFVASKTLRKFHPISNGANLAAEVRKAASAPQEKDNAGGSKNDELPANLPDLLPKEYGGAGQDLKEQGRQTGLE